MSTKSSTLLIIASLLLAGVPSTAVFMSLLAESSGAKVARKSDKKTDKEKDAELAKKLQKRKGPGAEPAPGEGDNLDRFAVTRTNSMREGPGGRYVSMALLSRGTRVISENQKRKGWLKVRLRDGRKGWVQRKNLRELQPRESVVRGGTPRAPAFYRHRRRPNFRGGFLFPLPGGKVNSLFGDRVDPISRRKAFHNGIDIAAPSGSPVRAGRPGYVSFAGRNKGYGKLVIVDHGLGFKTYYAHLRWISVRKGKRVAVGQMLGRVGNTGRTTGPHLHFEVRKNGRPVNPLLQRMYSGRSYR